MSTDQEYMGQGCTCEKCKSSCQHKPGWFLPNELEKVAGYLNISSQELFDQYLGVDWYEGFDDTFVIAPATTNMESGNEYNGDPRGQCVFFKDGLCVIHLVKPFECKDSICTESHVELKIRHRKIAEHWENYQDNIKDLLGRSPESDYFEGSFLGLSWY